MTLKLLMTLIFVTGLSMISTVAAEKRQIVIPGLPAPIAPYSLAILSTSGAGSQTLYMAGILPMLPSKELIEDPSQATACIMDQITALLKEAAMSWQDVIDVIILLRDINDFKAVSDSYGLYLANQDVKTLPVRLCFQAGKLPLNAVVEIKATAVKDA